MEKTGSNLIKITQQDVKIMLQERILNPTKYIDKPLLIWRGNFADGILRRVFFNFEPHVAALFKCQSDKQEAALPRWVLMKLDRLNNKFFLSEKDSNRVLCFMLTLPDQNRLSPLTYEQYSDFINTDWLNRLQNRVKAPIVVYLPFIERPEAFEGYDQYVFTPDFDDWKESFSGSNQLINHLVGFLDSSEKEEERDYRWFWYFQRQKEGQSSSDLRTGCDFPSCWEDGIGTLIRRYNLPMAQIPKGYIPRKPTKTFQSQKNR